MVVKKRVYHCYRRGQPIVFFNDMADPKTGKKPRCNKDKSIHACYIGSTKLKRDKRWFLESLRDSALRSGIK